MKEKTPRGVLVKPKERLSSSQVRLVDEVSRELLQDPGVLCYNREASDLFRGAGAKVEEKENGWKISIPSKLIDRALETAPAKITLGARDPENILELDAHEARVRFGSGSETNTWLEVEENGNKMEFRKSKGNLEKLCTAAHLAENLKNLDFFIRCVNVQDDQLKNENRDVNIFTASLNNITKHVQGGLSHLEALPDLIKLGQIVAGGKDAFSRAPVLSFITCISKSPLQIVNDTTDKHLAIARQGIPVVVSTSPMGGTTAPFDEFGMMAQINAEILASVTLNQLAAPGAPVLYGSVPVRSRLDNLTDMYGAPEFIHYNQDCAQMARFYGIPCYSTAGVGDTKVPGIQATAEKMLTITGVPLAGAQYIHYAFGLLDRTSIFSPEQAILDDAHISMVKAGLKEPPITRQRKEEITGMVKEVMASKHQTYIYHLPQPSKEDVYIRYPLEGEGNTLQIAHRKYREICGKEPKNLEREIREEVEAKIPGLVAESWSKPGTWLK